MGRKVLFVDFDGIIGDNTERADNANKLVDEVVGPLDRYIDKKKYEEMAKEIFYHKDNFYEPAAILQDKEIEGVKEKLEDFDKRGWDIVILTSLPEYRRNERLTWLCDHNIPFIELVCKDTDAFQYVKTTKWKRSIVRLICRILEVSWAIVIDDEQSNIDEILLDQQSDKAYILNGYTSFDQLHGMFPDF